MPGKKKVIPALIFLIIISVCSIFSVTAKNRNKSYDGWAWTKKNLAPAWMEWGKKYWPTKPVRGGYYRYAAAVYIGLMNPNHWPVNDWASIGLFYEGLGGYDGKYSQMHTWLMESWRFKSPTVLIMKLRRDVRFHDGTGFNAGSLKYVFDWIGDKRNGCWTRGQQDRIKSLQVIDDYTLKWTTYKPWGSFPQGFFSFQISPKALMGDVALRESKALVKRVKSAKKRLAKYERKGKAAKAAKMRKKIETLKKNAAEASSLSKGHRSTDVYPVGTGPFMYEKANPGNYLQVKRNPNWWFGRSIGKPEMPYFDGVKVTVIPDPSIQLANLRAGKIDTIALTKAQYRMVKDDPTLRIYKSPSNTTIFMYFNQNSGPCRDIRVRKAISHAIDRKALIAGTQFGMARIASCFYPGDHWAHNPKLRPVSYDVKLSKRLLKEAGYSNGLTLQGINYNLEELMTIGTAIRNMLVKAGIEWKVDVLDPAAIDGRFKNLEYDLAMGILPAIQDPDAHLSFIYHPEGGLYFNRNKNNRLIKLIEAGRYEVNQKKRQKIYYKIEEELYNRYMDVFLFWGIGTMAFRKNVEGWNNDMWIKSRTLYSKSHPLWFRKGRP